MTHLKASWYTDICITLVISPNNRIKYYWISFEASFFLNHFPLSYTPVWLSSLTRTSFIFISFHFYSFLFFPRWRYNKNNKYYLVCSYRFCNICLIHFWLVNIPRYTCKNKIHTCIHNHIYTHVHIHTHIHIYNHTYTHTRIHT